MNYDVKLLMYVSHGQHWNDRITLPSWTGRWLSRRFPTARGRFPRRRPGGWAQWQPEKLKKKLKILIRFQMEKWNFMYRKSIEQRGAPLQFTDYWRRKKFVKINTISIFSCFEFLKNLNRPCNPRSTSQWCPRLPWTQPGEWWFGLLRRWSAVNRTSWKQMKLWKNFHKFQTRRKRKVIPKVQATKGGNSTRGLLPSGFSGRRGRSTEMWNRNSSRTR